MSTGAVATSTPLIAILAGEDSGDQLGADLIAALRRLYPDAQFVGIGGTRMQAQGFISWYDIGELSLFGFTEVLSHLPRLLRLRRALLKRLLGAHPTVVIGIDAPDFNLAVERRLKAAGLLTVHYVSPSIWAWREKRAQKIGRSAQRVLCLFPMEPMIYARHGIDARFVGHPLADHFALVADRVGARESLQLPQESPVLAVLPGSRLSELERLGPIFIAAAARVSDGIPGLRIVIPAANAQVHARLVELLAHAPATDSAPLLVQGQAHEALLAADVVLLASGTATLEAMLAKRPMVVGYRVAPLSYRIAHMLRMIKSDVYSLPNILAQATGISDTPLVPELMQDNCTAANLANATLDLFRDSARRARIVAAFEQMHRDLRGDLDGSAADRAAAAIAELIASAPADA
ncbi:MAG: lipid-A-disaccharide synthase [Rhodanobacter sp.]